MIDIQSITRICTTCNLPHKLDQFTKNKTDKLGRNYTCFNCRNTKEFKEKRTEYNKKYSELNKEKRKQNRNKENQLARIRYNLDLNKSKIKNKHKCLKRDYQISLEDYNKMLISQNGKCAICNKHYTQCKQMLHVDHNHETNEIRGLLCGNCNPGLGLFKDDLKILIKAVNYLFNNDSSNLENFELNINIKNK